MQPMQKFKTGSECAMPALQRLLKNPLVYLLLFGLGLVLALLDASRDPSQQHLAGLYRRSIEVYQHFGRPLLEDRVRCRYTPSCSAYSSEAVRIYGIQKGLLLTVNRLSRCQRIVPMGSKDPVLLPD